MSIEYASSRAYLDDLYQIYPATPEGLRDIDKDIWRDVERAFRKRDNISLIKALLRLELFPLKDPYVAFLRHDPSAVSRNPATVNRLCGKLYELGLSRIYERCSEPKEINRRIGPMFRAWIYKGGLGLQPVNTAEFRKSFRNAILGSSDKQLLDFAQRQLGYRGDKRPDLIARFNNKYVIAEAKFITDFGGHQNRQFEDAIRLIEDKSAKAVKVAILDGVLYIKNRSAMFRYLAEHQSANIMSALVLREFLYQI